MSKNISFNKNEVMNPHYLVSSPKNDWFESSDMLCKWQYYRYTTKLKKT